MISLELNTLSVRTVGQFNFQRLGFPVPVVNSITRTYTHAHTHLLDTLIHTALGRTLDGLLPLSMLLPCLCCV